MTRICTRIENKRVSRARSRASFPDAYMNTLGLETKNEVAETKLQLKRHRRVWSTQMLSVNVKELRTGPYA